MYNYHNNHKNNHKKNNNQKHFAPRNDYSGAAMSAINRAYRDTTALSSSEVRSMMNYINTHRFYQSPAPSLHRVIDTYKNTTYLSSSDCRNQMWNVLHKYSR